MQNLATKNHKQDSKPANHSVKLEIRHLRLLTAVAEEGSVTEAGRRLHATQSALSHQLRDAEERLGTALFLRLGKKMVLTPAGEKLLDSAHKVLAELGSAEAQIEGLNGGTRAVIRLSTECYTCYHWLPPVMKKFQAKFPRVSLDIVLAATSRPLEALLEGKLDVAVTTSRVPRNKNVHLTPICDDEWVIAMASKHRLAGSSHIQPRDLAGETVFCYPPKEESTLLQRILRPAGVVPDRVLEMPLTESIIEMVAAGMGVALLAQWAVADHVKAGRIAACSLSKGGYRKKWYAATLRKGTISPCVEEFVSLLARVAPLCSVSD